MKRKGIENKPYIEGMRQIRQSIAAGTHENRATRRARTRQAIKNKAIREEKENG